MLAQVTILDLVAQSGWLPKGIMVLLLLISVLSWMIILAKWQAFSKARRRNISFLRTFRKAADLQGVAVGIQEMPLSPLVSVFEFGYEEVDRQVKTRGTVANKLALERSLQLGINEELATLDRYLNWLATTASISPFIGLFGTVWGIMDAFMALGQASGASLRAVAPSIGEALITTALGLAAAIPAAVAYNHFNQVSREMGARMDDFSLEFQNMAERTFGD